MDSPLLSYILYENSRELRSVQVNVLKAIKTTREFAYLSVETRQCYYPHEKTLRHFSAYSEANCGLECAWEFAKTKCHCVPWYLKRFYPQWNTCLVEKVFFFFFHSAPTFVIVLFFSFSVLWHGLLQQCSGPPLPRNRQQVHEILPQGLRVH